MLRGGARQQNVSASQAQGATAQLLSRGRVSLAVVTKRRGGARPGAVDQNRGEPKRPQADGRQEEGRDAVGLQEEVAGVGLPGEQQQHAEMHRQSPAAASRPRKVGTEGVAVATVVQAPAEV